MSETKLVALSPGFARFNIPSCLLTEMINGHSGANKFREQSHLKASSYF